MCVAICALAQPLAAETATPSRVQAALAQMPLEGGRAVGDVARLDFASAAEHDSRQAFTPDVQSALAAPILRANLMFRGVALEPGRHEIVFSYHPSAWRLGAAISLVAAIALAAAVGATYLRHKRSW